MPLRFLADENIASSVVKAIKDKGYDITSIKEKKRLGLPDERVIELAKKEKRIILTHDKDFMMKRDIPKGYGIVLIRFSNLSSENVSIRLLPVIEKLQSKMWDSVIVVTDDYIRISK